MKFRSRHLNLTIVVQPSEYVIQGVHKRRTKALRAYFRGGIFDSEVAQGVYHWSDEERDEVEKYLLEHPDFDSAAGFWVDQGTQSWAEVKVTDLAGVRCIFVFRTPTGDSEVCGKDIVPGTPYCLEHGKVAGWASAEPKGHTKEKTPATAG